MVFCNNAWNKVNKYVEDVTILILIDGFLQYSKALEYIEEGESHNPYFNRWFSAINNSP